MLGKGCGMGVEAVIENGQRRLRFPDGTVEPFGAAALERAGMELPTLRPVPLGLEPSFGFGDRTGLATPGHVRAMQRAGGGILPIFAQQSIREMARTRRTPEEVMADAAFGVLQAGYTGPAGADADHLKTPEDVARTAAAGFTFFTIDPSDDVDPKADDYSESELQAEFAAVRDEVEWLERYRNRSVRLDSGTTVEFTEAACLRAAVKYGRALRRTLAMASTIRGEMGGRPYEIELSVDETPQPTTLAEHWIIAEQCRENGVELVSLAPRYVGEFEKGVDYKGDLAEFEHSLRDHAAIAARLGPYKLSLHSGSDKLSLYPIFARVTGGRFHVKTAGTSYLEALRVAARHEPGLFREIVSFARERYDADRATYHVSATVAGTPAPETLDHDLDVERHYLELWDEVPAGKGFTAPGRQILHCTFGSVLNHDAYGPAVRSVLEAHPETYAELLEEHFARHLEALRASTG